MASMKAKKGNPHERRVAYNLMKAGYTVTRPDDNTSGIDLIVVDANKEIHLIECKHHKGFTWNQLTALWWKTKRTADKLGLTYDHISLVFKGNNQPPLVYKYTECSGGPYGIPYVGLFTDRYDCNFNVIPKGYKVWRDNGSVSNP